MKILKATKVFLKKLITKIISVFKKEVPNPDKIFDPPLIDYNVEFKKKIKGGNEPLFKSCHVEYLSLRKKRNMKILKAIKEFLKKLIMKIMSIFKTKVAKPKITITTARKLSGDITAETVENTVTEYAKTTSELMIQEYKNRLKRDDKKCLIHKKYVIINGKRVLGYVTSKQKLFGILNYDFSTNHKRCVYFDTREEAFKFMVEEYRSAFNKMWNIDSMFRYPINGYNQVQGLQLIRYYIKQLNNSKLDTNLVASEWSSDFDGDVLGTYIIK